MKKLSLLASQIAMIGISVGSAFVMALPPEFLEQRSYQPELPTHQLAWLQEEGDADNDSEIESPPLLEPQEDPPVEPDGEGLLGTQSKSFLRPNERDLSKDDYQSNWAQAGEGDGRLGTRLRTHVVRLQKDGRLLGRISLINSSTGRLIPVEQITVRFVRDGEVLKTVRPGPGGQFSVAGLKAGTYGMVADGEGAFIAWSVYLNPPYEELRVDNGKPAYHMVALQEEQSELAVDAAAVPPANLGQVGKLIARYAPPVDPNEYVEPDRDEIPEGATPGGNKGIGGDVPQEELEKQERDNAATSIHHHQVRLRADGTLRGRIRRLHNESGRPLSIRRLNVFFVRDNAVVQQVPVDRRGTFEAEDLEPGVYSLVAAGRDGFLAFSVQVIPTRVAANSKYVPAAFQAGEELNIDAALLDARNWNVETIPSLAPNTTGNQQQLADNQPQNNPQPPPAANGAAPLNGAPPVGGGAAGPGGPLAGPTGPVALNSPLPVSGGIGGGIPPAPAISPLADLLLPLASIPAFNEIVNDDDGGGGPLAPSTPASTDAPLTDFTADETDTETDAGLDTNT